MERLWNKEVEQRFFNEAQKFATPEQLFYVAEVCIGDYKTHQGNPGLLRSDSMLKIAR